ncbi:DUF3967 domain-containing protein [Bacillus sp. Au-Bac7]|uniref:DUF3967 domain-containing protein n=1 Tax=Bacillus sp. Au-Bac7 TaxID=2906458 RepID=UPI001E4EE710|nr:DUF3967 domain-containing protein [Bacillus sp. Au-Bac7]MCE4051871.1 MerR family transcriptional regulator [Bacillus sp. Au-Bac7]
MSEIIDIPFSNPEVAEQLGVATSSLRKWCLALEEQNYSFERTDQKKRLFYHSDIIVLRYFKELVTTKNMSLKNAATVITDRFIKENNKVFFNGTEVEHSTGLAFFNETENEQTNNEDQLILTKTELTNILRTQQEQLFIQLKEQLKHELIQDIKEEITTIQQDNNEELLHKIEAALGNQETAIKSNLEKRDKYLMESLKESMEVKKQLAATEEQSNKKKWYQIWK